MALLHGCFLRHATIRNATYAITRACRCSIARAPLQAPVQGQELAEVLFQQALSRQTTTIAKLAMRQDDMVATLCIYELASFKLTC
eukprot:CAMPEP_0197639870 /NCGR_PEP_ID=MMETSP1338-20131121/14358_1 /TAXON_ID=43686 ORGANISM="Pelagodinium beii, Strain RCC1491" /NCGR_SAMPLE_ID=MMETSP1338 /ASSEMBLY_ACC=CAM_ASM_000754 /LENGTH=85 /DNA_ID=CAMNT_0043212651 /DNA_START=805 /DNA_END=1063 /DNA_ORIENTATION=+